jgi:hypothetical protein
VLGGLPRQKMQTASMPPWRRGRRTGPGVPPQPDFSHVCELALAVFAITILLSSVSPAPEESAVKIGECEVYNRLHPGSMPFECSAHFPAVPVTME